MAFPSGTSRRGGAWARHAVPSWVPAGAEQIGLQARAAATQPIGKWPDASSMQTETETTALVHAWTLVVEWTVEIDGEAFGFAYASRHSPLFWPFLVYSYRRGNIPRSAPQAKRKFG